jgi:capsular exopolysaccharide synthesis family protein
MALADNAAVRSAVGNPDVKPVVKAAEDKLSQTRRGKELAVTTPTHWPLPVGDELFRGIYTRSGAGTTEALAVCSAIAGEGRTTISLGLGVTLAQDFPDQRVLVVETDAQRPALAADFDVEPTPGLVDCLLNEQPVQLAYRPTSLDNLQFVPVGGAAPYSGRLMRSSRMALALHAMRETHDVVILDLPPVLVNSDTLLLADLADGVIFVVRAGVTPSSLVNKALAQLDEAKLRGVVLNGACSSIPGWLQRLCGL